MAMVPKYYIGKRDSFPGGSGKPWCVWFGWTSVGQFPTWAEALRFVLGLCHTA